MPPEMTPPTEPVPSEAAFLERFEVDKAAARLIQFCKSEQDPKERERWIDGARIRLMPTVKDSVARAQLEAAIATARILGGMN